MQNSARIAMCRNSGGDGWTRVKLVMERPNTGTARTRLSFKTDGVQSKITCNSATLQLCPRYESLSLGSLHRSINLSSAQEFHSFMMKCLCTVNVHQTSDLRITLQQAACVAFGAFTGNSSLGSDGGSDARGRAAPSWLQNERHGAPVRSHQITDRTNTNAHCASGNHCSARHATCTLREATRFIPYRPSFLQARRGTNCTDRPVDWLQSLPELVPHLSRLSLSCVFSIIFLVELLLVALSIGRKHNVRIP